MKHGRLILTLLVAHASVVAAGPDDTAEAALKHANAAFKAGRIHEACDAYATADRLAPDADTEHSLATCYEQDGKPVSAARVYRALADRESDPGRKNLALAHAHRLEANAPKLRFAINPMPAGLVVKVDGMAVSATEDALVDTGPHEVIATAPGYEGHASAPVDRDRAIVDVIIRMEPRAEPAAPPAPALAPAATPEPAPAAAPAMPAMTAEPTATADHRKRNGYIAGGAGVAVLIGSAVVFAVSSSKFDDVHKRCPDDTCASPGDLSSARSTLSDGHTLRGVSIGMGIGGALLVAAGGYLVVTAHHGESPVSLQLDKGRAGMAYTVRF